MRAISFLITASIFSSLFIGLALMSAVLTDALHAKLVPRPVMTIHLQN
jgi:hypothetical protein